jgi:hypothetical protein
LANLPVQQRRIVLRAVYKQFWQEKHRSVINWLVLVGLICGTAHVLANEVLRPLGIRLYWLIEIAIWCVVFFVYFNALTGWLRPYFRKYISEHPNDFGQTGSGR